MLCVVLQKSPRHQRGSGCAGDEVGGAEGRYGKRTESLKGVIRATIRYPQEVLDGRYTLDGLLNFMSVCALTERGKH